VKTKTIIPWHPCERADWRPVSVKHAFETTLGKMLQPQPTGDTDSEVPYIKAVHVQWDGINFDDLPTMWASESELKQLNLRHGDLIVCEGGEVGRSALILNESPRNCIFQNALHRVRSLGENEVRYLRYCLLGASNADWFDVICNKATIAHFTVDKLREFKIWLPPISEQRRIADYLDRETGRIDALIAAKERLLALLAEKRAALISQLVTRGLDPSVPTKPSGLEWVGEIPKHWEVCRAKNLFSLCEDLSEDGTEELLTVSHITGVTTRSEKTVYMFEADDKAGYKRCQEGDFVINTLWAWMGAMGVSPQNGIVSPAYHVYTSKGKLLPQYVELLCRSLPFIAEVVRWSKGVWSSRLRLYPESFFEIHIPLPPLEEQQAIVEVTSVAQKRDSVLRGALERSITLARERRAALISAAVCGQIPL